MKPVNKEEFWRERIKSSRHLRHSVYITSSADWEHINLAHKDIFDKEIKDTDKVLDAGCGYGRWSELFVDYTGVDFSPDFIERAQKDYPDKNFIQANLKELPFKDKEFNVAFCVSVKEMIVGNLGQEEWDLMEKELKRVAKKVLLLEYSEPEKYLCVSEQ